MNNTKSTSNSISKPTSNISSKPASNSSTTQNFSKQSANTYKKSSTFAKVVFWIIIVLFILFIIYLIYVATVSSRNAAKNSPVIINDVIDAYVARPPFQLPPIIAGMGQTFTTWIYVKDWNYKFGQYKNILWKGNPPNVSTKATQPTISNIHCPSIWLYPLTNSLKVVTSTSVPESVESCDIQNIPLMTWVNIIYVLNNRTVDIYINGKLERSCALRGIPTITNDPVYITTGSPQPGFYGKMGKTQYFTKALLPNEIMNIYQKGPLGSSNYQVNFFKDGRLLSVATANSFANSNSS
jgi:hypothetical protein